MIRCAAAIFAMLGMAMLQSSTARADEALDTSKLPRVSGTKEIYASPLSTIFTTPSSVADTAAATLKALSAEGWQQYGRVSASEPTNADMVLASLKKGAQGLSVFINAAPAQNNATSVTYSGVPLAHDLPFPKNATDIKFDADRPHLKCTTPDTVEATSDFFRTELITRGWSPWSKEQSSKTAYADQKTEKGLYAYYVQDGQKPLILTLQKGDDGKTAVNLESIPPELIVAAKAPEPKVETPAPTEPAPTAHDKLGDAMDALAIDIMEQAKKATADALSGATAPKPKTDAKGDPSAQVQSALSPLDGNPAPIPVPATADGVEFDGSAGSLDFNSSSSVAEVVAFYRAQMKPLGWSERKTVINQPNMVALEFHKGEQEVSLTVMKMGASVNVTATGSALEKEAAAAPDTSAGDAASETSGSETAQALEVDEAGGLPVPKPHSLSGSEKSLFRYGANASVPAKLTAVLDFYRAELGKRAWSEDTAKTVIKPDQAVLNYTTPEGPAVLTLGRSGGETTVQLVIRQTEAAKKSGMMPKPGQTKLLFGNILETPATIVIAGKTIKVPGGAGSKGPDGPTLDVAPGKLAYSLKGSKAPMANDAVEVGADEIWGLMVGPGGVLPVQMY
jgi:hypothetical protein